MSDSRYITVVGTGVRGGQTAFATAHAGFEVTCLAIDDAKFDKLKRYVLSLVVAYNKDVPSAENGKSAAALTRILYTTDMADSLRDTDLVIDKLALAKTIFATDYSSHVPSTFAAASGRPSQFLALHHSCVLHKFNICEVLPHAHVSPETIAKGLVFARVQGMVPLEPYKEQPGLLSNSMLLPMLLAAEGVPDFETIDEAWMGATSAPAGPFYLTDIAGMKTAYQVCRLLGGETHKRFGKDVIKKKYIDKGRLGVSTGEGFYKYNPDGTRVDRLPEFGLWRQKRCD